MVVADEPVRLTLAGHPPVEGVAKLEFRPRSVRVTRAAVSLLGFWLLAPIVFFLPPHIPWAAGAFLAGLFFGYRNLRGTFIVHSFTAPCPRCQSPLVIAPGEKIRSPHTLDCYNCHFSPELEVVEKG